MYISFALGLIANAKQRKRLRLRKMAQAHETGTSQVGGAKFEKVFYGRIF